MCCIVLKGGIRLTFKLLDIKDTSLGAAEVHIGNDINLLFLSGRGGPIGPNVVC